MTQVDKLVLQYVTRGESSLQRSLSLAGSNISDVEKRAQAMNMAFTGSIVAGTAMAGVLGTIATMSLRSSGTMQANRVAFQQLLGSATAGNAKIRELQMFAAKTPFSMAGLVDNSKKLLAMGFTAKELIPTMTSLGNAMSALGGNDEMFSRVIYNLGQVRAQGKAYGRDIRQFAMAGINVVEVMAKATGKTFTQHQLTEMDGEDFIRNFEKGLDMKFGGMIDKMSKTLPGAINNMGDAFERLKIVTGDAISPLVIKGVNAITNDMAKLEGIVTRHPNLIKGAFIGGAGLAATMVGVGVLGKGAFYLNNIRMLKEATAAKKLLTTATKADDLAEGAKALTAGRETLAIRGTGIAAKGAAAEKLALAGATGEAAAASSLWSRAGGLYGRGARALGAPLMGAQAAGVSKYQALGMGRYRNIATGAFASRDVALAERAGLSGGRAGLSMLGGGSLSVGGAALGAGLGVGAGVSSFNNWKMAGQTTGVAAAAATVTGVGAGLVSMFVPGGAIAVAAGEGLAFALNKVVNEPMEKAAGGSMSNSLAKDISGMSHNDRASAYFKLRDEALARGDNAEAGSYLFAANRELRGGKKQAADSASAAADAKRAADNEASRIHNSVNDISGFYSRNGSATFTVPITPAGKSHNKLKANNNMTPNFL